MHSTDHIDEHIETLLSDVLEVYGYDFTGYSRASLKRRIVRLYELDNFVSFAEFRYKIRSEPSYFKRFLEQVTINVTEMFRDPEFYKTLKTEILPRLGTYPFIRIWIAGCSTGEEVYSLAILLREEGLLERTLIYATDINPASLEKARQGIFALGSIKGHTANYQQAGGQRAFSDYYTAAYEAAIFDKTLRENITFADHSLATDSVFSETQLVLCRNVLIYFNNRLQDRALGLFHDSLGYRGFLALGSKESLDFSAYSGRFEPLVRAERIFRKRSVLPQ